MDRSGPCVILDRFDASFVSNREQTTPTSFVSSPYREKRILTDKCWVRKRMTEHDVCSQGREQICSLSRSRGRAMNIRLPRNKQAISLVELYNGRVMVDAMERVVVSG
jgi:hypothetical protein